MTASQPHAETDAQLTRLIEADLIGMSYRELWPVFANFLVALVMWAALAGQMTAGMQTVWLTLTFLGLSYRFVIWFACHRLQPRPEQMRRWGLAMAAGLGIVGVQWGLSALLVLGRGPSNELMWPDVLQVSVLMGLSAAAAAQYSAWRPAFHCFLWPATLPFAIAYLLHPVQYLNHLYLMTGVMILLFALAINLISAGLNRTLIENIALKHDHARIANDLDHARATAEAASNAKSEFLASMSHELRTPLNAILGFSEMMLEQYHGPLAPRYREYCQDVHDSARHLLDLINDVLDISRIESGRYELDEMPLSLTALTESAVRLVRQRAATKGVSIEIRPGGTPLVAADERAMRQILVNLLGNAVKFTPTGGQITVTTATLDNGSIEIAVEDTGVGIPAEELPRITGMYMQGREGRRRGEEGGGTGLGLAICQGLVGLHQGELLITSAPGEGTRVALRLPPERVVPGGG